MRHSELPPVLDVIVVDGHEIAIHYAGTWADLCRNYVRSLPQNSATLQGGNHANRPADVGGAVNPGGAAVLGSVPSGGEER